MILDPETCYQALLSRDRRFDGWFFIGVSSTGIYCRPVCPVRAPKQANCHFFPHAAAAEKAGYRPCLRCRPELAPGHGLLDLSSRLARAAATLIEDGFLNGARLDALARRVGVTERHLRRIFDTEFGVSPIEFAQTQRLLLAKRLLTDTRLSMTQVALTAGFGSVRRFNDVFHQQYGLTPTRLRKTPGARPADTLTFMLGYRPPFSWSGVLAFLAQRRIDGVEYIDQDKYVRTIALPYKGHMLSGWLSVSHAPQRHGVEVTLPATLVPLLAQILGRMRRLFDLGSRPDLIDAHLGPLAADLPGMRVPGAFDGFEIAVRAIVGQQVSVTYARTVLARIAERFGTPAENAPCGLRTTFPDAAVVAALPADALYAAGITHIRAQAVVALAAEVAAGRIVLEPLAPLDETLAALRRIRGVGEWTVQYIAMRSLAWPNAFLQGDAVLKRRLGLKDAAALARHAAQWEPWRAYATLHVWRQDAATQA